MTITIDRITYIYTQGTQAEKEALVQEFLDQYWSSDEIIRPVVTVGDNSEATATETNAESTAKREGSTMAPCSVRKPQEPTTRNSNLYGDDAG